MGATSRYCLPQLIRRGEYDPTWLDTGMPLTESLETQAFVLHSVTDLELMPKRRRLERFVQRAVRLDRGGPRVVVALAGYRTRDLRFSIALPTELQGLIFLFYTYIIQR